MNNLQRDRCTAMTSAWTSKPDKTKHLSWQANRQKKKKKHAKSKKAKSETIFIPGIPGSRWGGEEGGRGRDQRSRESTHRRLQMNFPPEWGMEPTVRFTI